MSLVLAIALLPAFFSAIVAFLATPFVIKLAWKIKIIDDPKTHKHEKVIHTYPVPRGGVLAIYLAVFASILLFLPIDKHILGILAGLSLIAVMGILDDKYNLNPYHRLIVQFFAAMLPIAAGIGIAFLTNPFNGILDLSNPRINFFLFGEERSIWLLSDLFALLWIVFMMNILNMGAKGIDGQLTGTVVIAAAAIALLSLKFSADITEWPVIILASITAGSFLGFLPWHIYPQKIMPSFGGANLAGFLLATLAILSTTKVGTLTVVLGVPLVDTGYTVVRRILSGKSPVWGDRGHLHHKLLDAGWSKQKIASFYWLATGILGFLTLNLNATSKFYTIVGTALIVGGTILWLTYRPKLSK